MFLFLSLFFIAGLIWLTGRHIWQLLVTYQADIRQLEESSLAETVPCKALLIKDERPVPSPLTGKLEMLARDGERLRAGTPLAKVTGAVESRTIYSPEAGILCTGVDGLEGILTPGNIASLDMEAIPRRATGHGPVTAQVEKGKPFCKLIDNLNPLIMYVRLGDKGRTLEKSSGDKITLLWQGNRMTGRVKDIAAGSRGQELVLSFAGYPEELLHLREINGEILLEELKGYAVPGRALVFRGTRAGIYIVEEQFTSWVPVDIEGYSRGLAYVSGDGLFPGTSYVSNPGKVRQGDRVVW